MKKQYLSFGEAILLCLLFLMCCCTKQEDIRPLGHEFEIDARLPVDSLGYYHLQLSQEWQTIHRISGQVSTVEASYNLATISWESSHYWYIGDTLGYIVHFNNPENDIYLYSNRDTAYITWFDGFEVETINGTSYQTEDGEINTMFAPVRSMKTDTVDITATISFTDGYIKTKKIKIILEWTYLIIIQEIIRWWI